MVARRQSLQGLLFVLPALAFLIIFLIVPVLWTIRLSLYRGSFFSFDQFVGLDNYVRLLTRDRLFLNLSGFPPTGAVINNVLWVVLYVALCVGFGVVIAALADRVRYEAIIKAIIFVPMAISATAVAVIWLLVYSPFPQVGVLNAVVTGLGGSAIGWLGRPDTVNLAIIVAAFWGSAGFATVIFSAAIKGIPVDIVEAARVDGATNLQVFRQITLPLIGLPIAVVTVTLVITVIKVFDVIYIMSRGGPNGASRVIAYTFFEETFQGGKGGYGAAVAVIMILLVIPLMIFNIRRFRTEAVIR